MSILLLLLILVFFSSSNTSSTIINTHLTNFTDQQSLLSFKQHIISDPLHVLSNWNASTAFCNWNGVNCSNHRQRVTSLYLNGMSLTGTIAPHIGNLSFLISLDLGNNSFHDTLPHEIGRLRRLRTLILSFNQLQGQILKSLTGCQKLRTLLLSVNRFHGTIPNEIGLLPHLSVLSLPFNSLTGPIPASLGNLSSLEILYLSGNKLDGMVPPSLFNSSSLTEICIGLNNLHGHLPILALPNLERLILNVNQFIGPIPSSLFNSSKLKFISLAANNFSGPVPLSWDHLPLLEVLNLENNQLVNGENTAELTFLTSLTNCRFLRIFILNYNPLGGVLPCSIGNLSHHLEYFSMHGNQIKGTIPAEIGNLTSLIALVLSSNALDGMVPSDIGRIGELQLLVFSTNSLQGSIPSSLGHLKNLENLYLYKNRLSGEIPHFLKNLTRLEILELNDNTLSGKIPSGVWSSTNMISIDFSNNYLSGFLPWELGSLDHLDFISVSGNQLSGEIPKTLGKLVMARYLNLSENSFVGSIPLSFSNLISMESLDISMNNLSGIIPKSLASLRYLKYLNLSFNKLEGEIPNGGIFTNLSFMSIVGNPALCGGAPEFQLQACPQNHRKKRGSRPKIIIIIPTVLLVVFGFGFYFSWVLHRRKKLRKEDSTSLMGEHRRISYHEIRRATDNFSDANLLGIGSFGSIYKGTLFEEGTTVAIKVLNLQMDRASKSFDIECKVLSSVRHRNLVKIITSCSNLDFKALVLQFMSNGSLDKWLYPDNGGDCELNMLQRMDIAIDVASAMEYLHHGYSSTIIHCDLKPSNVLLDEDLVAHVGDFGISRLLIEDHSITPTSMVGSIGYIAPEYGQAGRISIRGDVYSFGILLLELFTRRKPTDSMFTGGLSLPKWIHAALPHAIMEIIDEKLWREHENTYHVQNEGERNGRLDHLSSIIKVGLSCASESIEERIDMRESLARLKNIRKGLVLGS